MDNEKGLKNLAKLVNNGAIDINITLTADITLTGEWTPIGIDDKHQYIGTFDGGNHTISGLTVTGSDQYAGLFGYIGSGGTVKDLTLEGVQITTTHSEGNAGGVAGWSYGTLENCSVSGSVIGRGKNSIVGGGVGSQNGGFLTGCSSSATVNAGNAAGGVVGSNGPSSTLQACYAWGSVTGSGSGTIYAGGVTGTNDLGTLTACYHAKGTVSGPGGATGGVAGRNFKDSMFGGGIITACYWGDNGQEQGIGEDQVGTGETTKVTDGDWLGAKDAMNAALNGLTTCYYNLSNEGLPVLMQR